MRALPVAVLVLIGAISDSGWAHDPPAVTGIFIDGSTAVLRSTRGLILGDLDTRQFRLQCLEYSGLGSFEVPQAALFDGRAMLATVDGLIEYGVDGCRSPGPAGIEGAVTDVVAVPDGTWLAVTVAVTDSTRVQSAVFRSDDGTAWLPVEVDLDGSAVGQFRPFGDGYVASGVELTDGGLSATHFVRRWSVTDGVARQEVSLEFASDPTLHRVRITDVTSGSTPEALVVIDRFAVSGLADEVFHFDGDRLRSLASAADVADARFGPRGEFLVATSLGLMRVGPGRGVVTALAGTPITALAVADGAVFVSSDYAVDGFALAELCDGDPLVLLRYEELVGPTECPDAAGRCAPDWLDWMSEIPHEPAALASAPRCRADAASGCSHSSRPLRGPLGGHGWTLVIALLATASQRRR